MIHFFRNARWVLAIVLLIAASVTKGQYNRLELPEAGVNAGGKFSFKYNTAGTPLEGMSNVSCILYYFDNKAFCWRGADVPLSKITDSTWKGEYTTTPESAFITFKFLAGDSVDNNKNDTYGYLLLDSLHPGLNAPSSRAAWGLLRSPGYGYTIDGYVDGSRSISDMVTNYWLDMELRQPFVGEGRSVFVIPFAQSLYKAYGNEKIEKIYAAIQYLTRKDAPQTDRVRAWYIASKVINDNKKADSIAQQIHKSAPVNLLTKWDDYKKFMQLRQSDSITITAAKFLDKYPYEKTEAWFDDLVNIEYNRLFLSAILGRIQKNDFASIDTYLDQMPFVTTITIYYKTIDVTHSRKMMADSFLYNYSLKLMGRMEQLRKNQPQEYSYMSPIEWNTKVDEALFAGLGSPMYVTHASICNSLGKYEETLKYASMVESVKQFKQADVNDLYVEALRETGHLKEAKEVLLKSIYENQASVAMLDLLKQDYIKEHGSEKGFDTYLQSLKKEDTESSHALEGMINKPMPDFTMKDAKGKQVSLKSLKGKVVILDFWAQWCIPCKASFPGMKLAVDKYKNDPEVVFYFVDTEEDINSNYKKANIDYLKNKNFDFNLLFDNPTKDGKKIGEVFGRVCKEFTISGIPQKILIDKQGNVRLITVGFKGSATQLSDELSEMIEAVKKM